MAAGVKPETLERMSAASKARWADPEYRKRMETSHAKNWSDPEKRTAILSKINRKGHHKPHTAATRERMRERALKRCEDPAYRAKLAEWAKSCWTPERRERQRAALNAGHARRRAAKAANPVDPEIAARAQRNAAKAKAYLAEHGFK